MAISNHERIGKALEVLRGGLEPFVESRLSAKYGSGWLEEVRPDLPHHFQVKPDGEPHWDAQALLKVMWKRWNDVFGSILGQADRSYVSELMTARDNWAHQKSFSTDDAYRTLDTMTRLLAAVSSPAGEEIEKSKQELLRTRFDEQARYEKRKAAAQNVEGTPATHLRPWREIVTPHPDVASGRYQQAEFAADLFQVHVGEGADEYRDPIEFFRRTYLTQGLTHLLSRGLMRLGNNTGDPVIELQTNFGGGKTHSMLALFHLFSGIEAEKLPGIEAILKETGLKPPKKVRRAVFVGTKTPPGQPHQKPDGTVVRTMWGDIAWQLGGKPGYELVRESDERGTSPGERMTDVFRKFGPCLILIDEWVAYARQLYGNPNLPAGTFDTHFTWAQSLSESAKAAPNTLLIVSVPSSENEIGGDGGKMALDRLKNAIGRIESPWRPASTEEGYEIVRRRLFQPFADNDKFVLRDAVVRAFGDLYRTQGQEFPTDAREAEYERRMKSAYPIHPELFERLFNDWSSLDKFQRTRGVLRLMASVIHTLWEREDRTLMIMPASIPIDDPGVQFELTRYLDDQWNAVIEKDVDGSTSLPMQIDRENPNFGRYSACRRVARTLYLGSAPTLRAANKGLEDRQIRLGCVQPGETPATFGDALRRLSDRATYLFVNAQRYWYSTQPTVTRLAQDRGQRYTPDDLHEEIKRRLIEDAQNRGEFSRVHTCPASSSDVPDEMDARLVILPPGRTHSARSTDSEAIKYCAEIIKQRGASPRNYQNSVVFLAADKSRVAELEAAVRDFLAWKSVDEEHEELNLDAFQRNQAATKRKNNHETVDSRLLETYSWVLAPHQPDAQKPELEWSELRLQGAGPLAVRAMRKLIADAELYRVFSGSNLRLQLDKIPLWRGQHVGVRQLQDDFARYLYLPRLKGMDILLESIMEGTSSMTVELDGFFYADSWDEGAARYRGLKYRDGVFPKADGQSVVVKAEVALAQVAEERRVAEEKKRIALGQPAPVLPAGGAVDHVSETPAAMRVGTGQQLTIDIKPTRFHGSIDLNAARVSRDTGRVADEVIAHLVGLMRANVKVTLEIEAEIPDGVPDHVVRTVSENCRTLQFKSSGFEVE